VDWNVFGRGTHSLTIMGLCNTIVDCHQWRYFLSKLSLFRVSRVALLGLGLARALALKLGPGFWVRD